MCCCRSVVLILSSLCLSTISVSAVEEYDDPKDKLVKQVIKECTESKARLLCFANKAAVALERSVDLDIPLFSGISLVRNGDKIEHVEGRSITGFGRFKTALSNFIETHKLSVDLTKSKEETARKKGHKGEEDHEEHYFFDEKKEIIPEKHGEEEDDEEDDHDDDHDDDEEEGEEEGGEGHGEHIIYHKKGGGYKKGSESHKGKGKGKGHHKGGHRKGGHGRRKGGGHGKGHRKGHGKGGDVGTSKGFRKKGGDEEEGGGGGSGGFGSKMKKEKKYMQYAFMVLLGIFGLTGPLVMKTLAVIAAKALIASKMALIIVGSVALKKIFEKDHDHPSVKVHTITADHEDEHDRVYSYNQVLPYPAYSAYAKPAQ